VNLPNEFITFDTLGTLAGLSLAVFILVSAAQWAGLQFPTKTAAVIVAVVLSVLVTVLGGNITGQAILMSVINGALAALVSTGFSSAVNEVYDRRNGPQPKTFRHQNIAGAPPDDEPLPVWYERW